MAAPDLAGKSHGYSFLGGGCEYGLLDERLFDSGAGFGKKRRQGNACFGVCGVEKQAANRNRCVR